LENIYDKKYLQKKEWLGFGLAATAGYMVAGISQMYLTIFFTDILLLSPTFILVLMLVARIWDAINDPIMGIFIDKTKTPYGKMRPYVFIGAILMAVSTIVLFIPITGASNIGKNGICCNCISNVWNDLYSSRCASNGAYECCNT